MWGPHPHVAFFIALARSRSLPITVNHMATQEEIDAIQETALATAQAGVSSASTDGVQANAISPMDLWDFKQRVANDQIARPSNIRRLISHARIVSPGCGS